MKDYQNKLDEFTDYSNKKKIEEYLKIYWLDKNELKTLATKAMIYHPNFKALPDPIFNEHFDIVILKGGSVLYKEEFELLQSCMRAIGDKYFFLVEDYDEETSSIDAGPSYRFKFPVDITWDIIMSGAEISYDVFLRPIRNFFVFGDSGQWGRYVSDDYDYPLDIIGFDRRYSDLFHSKFRNPPEDIDDLKEWTAYYGMKLPGID
jgi:hypothetical protein